jgi:putative hydrolase of the HAD superfamily
MHTDGQKSAMDDCLVERIREMSAELPPQPTDADPRLVRLEDVKAVLFDIYGTLFISASGDIGVLKERQNGGALVEALKACGFSDFDPALGEAGGQLFIEAIDEAHQALKAQGVECPEVEIRSIWRDVLKALKREGLLRCEVNADMLECMAVEYECRVNPVWPMPGARELIETLAARNTVLGIVSNAQFFTPLLFPALMGDDLETMGFERSCCIYSYRFWQAKPSTVLFEKALDALHGHHGIEPEDVLYVGNDMLNDMLPAAKTGCRTALFAGDCRSLRLREEVDACRQIKPDIVLTGLHQLIPLLTGP